MKNILKIIGWLGMAILSLLDFGNPTIYERKPNEETAMIIGFGFVLILIIVSASFGYYLYTENWSG